MQSPKRYLPFFPKSKIFWACHCGGWALLIAFSLLLAYTFRKLGGIEVRQDEMVFNLASSIFTLLSLTLASLIFIQIYYRQKWHQKNWLELILRTLAFAILAGYISAALTGPAVSLLSLMPASHLKEGFIKGYMKLTFYNGFINTMIESIWLFIYVTVITFRRARHTETNALKYESALKEARLNTLIGQINPHFIFNALNNIRGLIIEDANKARTMITELSSMLRTSLNSDHSLKIPLSEELETINSFIALSSIQFEKRLKFSQSIPEGSSNILLPPMILQMMVENAVKHGIDKLKNGGKIHLNINVDKEFLTCEVTNDGHLPQQPLYYDNNGVGLSNIKARLNLQYGPLADFQLTEKNGQVSARIKLPKETA